MLNNRNVEEITTEVLLLVQSLPHFNSVVRLQIENVKLARGIIDILLTYYQNLKLMMPEVEIPDSLISAEKVIEEYERNLGLKQEDKNVR